MLIDLFSFANMETFYKKLLLVTNIQVYDPSPIYMFLLPLERSEPVNIHFEDTGYESSDFVLNSGSIGLTIATAPFFILLTYIVRRTCCCCSIKLAQLC